MCSFARLFHQLRLALEEVEVVARSALTDPYFADLPPKVTAAWPRHPYFATLLVDLEAMVVIQSEAVAVDIVLEEALAGVFPAEALM